MELASLQEELKEVGWNLSDKGLQLISENGKITDKESLIEKAKNVDLRTISKGGFPEDLSKTKYEEIPGNIVLQIQKVKNLSSPKTTDSHCPRTSILKLNLTDGIQNIQAIIMEPIPNVHINTYPGSKILITSETVEISHSLLLLSGSNTKYLGGKVNSMVEKWELNKKLAKHTRQMAEGGPPPWIGFGEKLLKQTETDKNFKSLDINKAKDSMENTEFQNQRQDAILEATKIGCTKVFGGGNNKLLDRNVQLIIDEGFTIEDAEYALKINRNNLDKSLRYLRHKYNKSGKDENSKSSGKGGHFEERKGGRGRNKHRDEESLHSQKPSAKVSLFEFLEDKLPMSEPPDEPKPSTPEKKPASPNKTVGKSNFKDNAERGKYSYEERRDPDFKTQKKNYDSTKSFNKSGVSDKKSPYEKKSHFGKFDSKKNIDTFQSSKTDKNFSHYNKSKYEMKNGDSSNGKNDFFKNKAVEKRTFNNFGSNTTKQYGRQTDWNDGKKSSGFNQGNEKPPRFQRYQYQQNESQGIQSWSDPSYNRISPQADYQLQNSIANLSLQQNVTNFQNQNSQDMYAMPDILAGLPGMNTKQNSMFFQNLLLPSSQSNDSRIIGSPTSQPSPHQPPPHQPPPHQSHLNTYGNRSVGGFMHQEAKNSTFSNMPSLPDNAFKNNGNLLHGFNEFQSLFGSPRQASNNFPNTSYLSGAGANGMSPQSQKTWVWNKGDKCMARYWEDQMYYNAVVTGVSENTCVVRFTDYGNYEEVLQDHCIPVNEDS